MNVWNYAKELKDVIGVLSTKGLKVVICLKIVLTLLTMVMRNMLQAMLNATKLNVGWQDFVRYVTTTSSKDYRLAVCNSIIIHRLMFCKQSLWVTFGHVGIFASLIQIANGSRLVKALKCANFLINVRRLMEILNLSLVRLIVIMPQQQQQQQQQLLLLQQLLLQSQQVLKEVISFIFILVI